MLSLGLLGCGRIGQVHARSLSRIASARLTAVADFVPAAAQSLADAHGAEVRSAEDIIAASDIDAVIIATPTSLHYAQIHALAAAGKAIFCEKPIDLSAARAAECQAAVEAADVPFLTAFNRRFDPSFAHLKAQLDAGVIGATEMVVITSRDPSPPPASYIAQSGGLFRDMMIHDLDMARFLLGEEPVELFATGSCLVDPEIGAAGDVDTAAVTLKTATGKIALINNSRRATYGYDQRIEVHGAKGMLRAANQLENLVEVAGATGFTSAPNTDFFLERYEAAYLAEMTAFITAITTKTNPSPNITDGAKAQKLADAAQKSMENNTPVNV